MRDFHAPWAYAAEAFMADRTDPETGLTDFEGACEDALAFNPEERTGFYRKVVDYIRECENESGFVVRTC